MENGNLNQKLKTLILFATKSGFLRWPWIQGQPWKVLEFQKTEKGLELFWNLSIVKVSTRLVDCVNCHSCCKAGKRTAQTVLLINITHQCFKSVCLVFSSISRAVCYRMIDWKKDIELALNYWIKRPWKAFLLGLLAQEPCKIFSEHLLYDSHGNVKIVVHCWSHLHSWNKIK